MNIKGAVVLVLTAAMVTIWGSGDEQEGILHRGPSVGLSNWTGSARDNHPSSHRVVLDVLGTSRDSLMDGVRSLASARRFAAKVGREAGAEGVGAAGAGGGIREVPPVTGRPPGNSASHRGIGGGVDACPPAEFKEAALRAYGVEDRYAEALIAEEGESSCIVYPCVTGTSGERGPLQFMLGTWAGTPYAEEDRCNPIAAWHALGYILWRDGPVNGPRHWRATWPN